MNFYQAILIFIGSFIIFAYFIPYYVQLIGYSFAKGVSKYFSDQLDNQFESFYKMNKNLTPKKKENEDG